MSETEQGQPTTSDHHGQEVVAMMNQEENEIKEKDVTGKDVGSENVENDLERMKDAVFFLYPDRNQRLSRFWLLITLAAIIATSGLAGDSVATVIGAMIVAPLMTPILGTMLAIVIGDGRNFVVSLTLVLTGGAMAVFIGYVIGLCVHEDTILAVNNAQVAARTEPKLTDLLGALATGAVASVALVRRDIADTLPGVAISISLVPPLNVIGIALSTNNGNDAVGAFLLFATNFTSILFMGVIVMYMYRVQYKLEEIKREGFARRTGSAFLILLALLGVVSVPLALTSKRLADVQSIEQCLQGKFEVWTEPQGWDVSIITVAGRVNDYDAKVIISGSPPFPDLGNVTDTERKNPCNVNSLEVSFVPRTTYEF
jgi:uncharacterized hydrophobic protein (TIGR00271 family)